MATVSSNIPQILNMMRAGGAKFGKTIEGAIMENGKLVLKECIVQIDALIYSQPESPYYRRTKNLRRSHHMRKIAPLAVLIFNDAQYSGWVHDGTIKMSARPWMEQAIANTAEVQIQNLTEAGTKALLGG